MTLQAGLVTLALPSLVQKLGREKCQNLKRLAQQHHCVLSRVRRSRHWQLVGEEGTLKALCHELLNSEDSSEDYAYVRQKIEMLINARVAARAPAPLPLNIQLAQLIAGNPNITLTELMEKTDCTLAQARSARFQEESW
ncbi:ribosome recycling factor [Vibrio cholerae]